MVGAVTNQFQARTDGGGEETDIARPSFLAALESQPRAGSMAGLLPKLPGPWI